LTIGRDIFVGHCCPIYEPGGDQLDVPFLGGSGHELLEAGETKLFLVKIGKTAHHPLFD
jgi:hypothetical protein